ncbi:MAG: hypothetical protein LBB94_02290 [Clostridiales bacterium]|jgi:predicted SAM-dependent methyltransferase|nr:hypothetical protein [Clostridiales bacterium]
MLDSIRLKRLEIGAGNAPVPGYLHQDIIEMAGVRLDYKCMPYEIPDNGFDLIIALGVMEHLRFDEFEKTIEHFLMILNIEGEFLFDVPNLKIWCQYYVDICAGKETPFDRRHVLRTIYGWQRWIGDEHKSGWDEKSLKRIIESKREGGLRFAVDIQTTPDIFKEIGISRNRFDRPQDAHLYVSLTKTCDG